MLSFFFIMAASFTRTVSQVFLAVIGIPVVLNIVGFAIRLPSGSALVEPLFPRFLLENRVLQIVFLILSALCWGVALWRRYNSPRRKLPAALLYIVAIVLLVMGNLASPPEPVPVTTVQLPEAAVLEVNSLHFERTETRAGGGRSTSVESDLRLWLSAKPSDALGVDLREVEYGIGDVSK